MANWQGFSFGGWAPAETWGESAMQFAWNGKDLRRNVRYQKRLMKFQQGLNQENALWNSSVMPGATVAGLRAANLNPILAVTGAGGLGIGSSGNVNPTTVNGGSSYVEDGSTSAFGDAESWQKLIGMKSGVKAAIAKNNASAKTAESTADANVEKVQNEAESAKASAIAGEYKPVTIGGQTLQQNMRTGKILSPIQDGPGGWNPFGQGKQLTGKTSDTSSAKQSYNFSKELDRQAERLERTRKLLEDSQKKKELVDEVKAAISKFTHNPNNRGKKVPAVYYTKQFPNESWEDYRKRMHEFIREISR